MGLTGGQHTGRPVFVQRSGRGGRGGRLNNTSSHWDIVRQYYNFFKLQQQQQRQPLGRLYQHPQPPRLKGEDSPRAPAASMRPHATRGEFSDVSTRRREPSRGGRARRPESDPLQRRMGQQDKSHSRSGYYNIYKGFFVKMTVYVFEGQSLEICNLDLAQLSFTLSCMF